MELPKKIWKVVGMPVAFLCVISLFWFIWRESGMPQDDALIVSVKEFFERHGYWLIIGSAILEGTLFLGLYYPGSIIIFLGVMFVHESISSVVTVVLSVCLGLFIAHTINYMLGKYGWYKLLVTFGLEKSIDTAKQKLTHYGSRAIFLSYWHPNLGAFVATAAGILHFSFKKFTVYSVIAITGWNTFWGIVAYFVGDRAIKLLGFRFGFLCGLFWLAYRILEFFIKKKRALDVARPSGV